MCIAGWDGTLSWEKSANGCHNGRKSKRHGTTARGWFLSTGLRGPKVWTVPLRGPKVWTESRRPGGGGGVSEEMLGFLRQKSKESYPRKLNSILNFYFTQRTAYSLQC